MIEHWERTRITGNDGERQIVEFVLHKQGEDPMMIAFKRNRELAGCTSVRVESEGAFTQVRKEDRREKKEIPRDGDRYEEWEW